LFPYILLLAELPGDARKKSVKKNLATEAIVQNWDILYYKIHRSATAPTGLSY